MADRTRPGVGWELEQRPDGTYDVRHDGRAAAYDRADLHEALAWVRGSRAYRPGEPVTHIDGTGYREAVR